jgi:colanic acid biosynthesis protein WcaH
MSELIEQLESAVKNPTAGLPEELFLFLTRVTPMVNVDLLIQNAQRETLLTWRDDALCPPGWHIPGGIIRFKEPAGNRIRAVAAGELGAQVKFGDKPLAIHEFIHPSRRVRGHFISLLYDCALTSALDPRRKYAGAGTPRPGEWAWQRQCPENLICVQRIYAKYFDR